MGGDFGVDALTSTQIIHREAEPLDFTNFDDSTVSPTSGLFVFPEQQFAVCVITKVASTQWNKILLQMIDYNMSGYEELEGEAEILEKQKRDFFQIGAPPGQCLYVNQSHASFLHF